MDSLQFIPNESESREIALRETRSWRAFSLVSPLGFEPRTPGFVVSASRANAGQPSAHSSEGSGLHTLVALAAGIIPHHPKWSADTAELLSEILVLPYVGTGRRAAPHSPRNTSHFWHATGSSRRTDQAYPRIDGACGLFYDSQHLHSPGRGSSSKSH